MIGNQERGPSDDEGLDEPKTQEAPGGPGAELNDDPPTVEHRGGPPLSPEDVLSLSKRYGHLTDEEPDITETDVSGWELATVLHIANKALRDTAEGLDAAREVAILRDEFAYLEAKITLDSVELENLRGPLRDVGNLIANLPYRLAEILEGVLRGYRISGVRQILVEINKLEKELVGMSSMRRRLAFMKARQLRHLKERLTPDKEYFGEYFGDLYGLDEPYIPKGIPDNINPRSREHRIFHWRGVQRNGLLDRWQDEHTRASRQKEKLTRSLDAAKEKRRVITAFFERLIGAENGRFKEIIIEEATPTKDAK